MTNKIFENLQFSFFAYFKSKKGKIDNKRVFEDMFGSSRVLKCLNRFDTKITDVSEFHISKFFKTDLNESDQWILMENFLGCIQNDIDV